MIVMPRRQANARERRIEAPRLPAIESCCFDADGRQRSGSMLSAQLLLSPGYRSASYAQPRSPASAAASQSCRHSSRRRSQNGIITAHQPFLTLFDIILKIIYREIRCFAKAPSAISQPKMPPSPAGRRAFTHAACARFSKMVAS